MVCFVPAWSTNIRLAEKCLIPRKGVNRKLALDLLFHLTYYKANCSSSRNGQGINAQPSFHWISGGQS